MSATLDYLDSLAAPTITGKARMDSSELAAPIMRRQETLESERSIYDSLWQEIANLVTPRAAVFTQKGMPNLRSDVFDSTAPLASDRFAAAFDSILTPMTQQWHTVKPTDEELADDTDVKRWCDETTKRLFEYRYSPQSNFASQIHEVYKGLGDFGTGALYSEEMPGEGIAYRACNLAGLYIVQDFQGRIRYVHYKEELSAEQAAQRFTADALPPTVKAKLDQRPDDKSTFLHCVRANSNLQYGHRGPAGMAFESVWVSVEGRQVVGTGGFRTFPYAVSRYVTRPGQVYGDSPAMMALADVRMLNIMGQTLIQEAQFAAQPALLAPQDGILSAWGDNGISLIPGEINYGGLAPNGNPLVKAFEKGSNFAPAKEEMSERRQTVNAAFLVTLFQILVDSGQMTATEVLEKAQEKGALLAPTAGRQQSELLGPLVAREIDLLQRAGALSPLPRKLVESPRGYKLEYNSPMTRAIKAQQGVGILRTLQALAPIAQIDRTVLDRFNTDEIANVLGDINGVPAKCMLSDDEVAAKRKGRAQAEQAQQLLNATPAMAGAAKDMADAQATLGRPAF